MPLPAAVPVSDGAIVHARPASTRPRSGAGTRGVAGTPRQPASQARLTGQVPQQHQLSVREDPLTARG